MREFKDILIDYLLSAGQDNRAVCIARKTAALEEDIALDALLRKWDRQTDAFEKRQKLILQRVMYGHDEEGTRVYDLDLEETWYTNIQYEGYTRKIELLEQLIDGIIDEVYFNTEITVEEGHR